MGACFGKPKLEKLVVIDPQNEKDHKLIMISLGTIEKNFNEIAQNNNGYLSKIESQFESTAKKNEETSLANRDQIDYLIKNCAAFAERIKKIEVHVKDEDIHISNISKSQAIRAIQAIQEIPENEEISEISEIQEI